MPGTRKQKLRQKLRRFNNWRRNNGAFYQRPDIVETAIGVVRRAALAEHPKGGYTGGSNASTST